MGSGAVTRSLDIIIFGRDFPFPSGGSETPEDEEKWVTHFSHRDIKSVREGGMRNIDGQ